MMNQQEASSCSNIQCVTTVNDGTRFSCPERLPERRQNQQRNHTAFTLASFAGLSPEATRLLANLPGRRNISRDVSPEKSSPLPPNVVGPRLPLPRLKLGSSHNSLAADGSRAEPLAIQHLPLHSLAIGRAIEGHQPATILLMSLPPAEESGDDAEGDEGSWRARPNQRSSSRIIEEEEEEEERKDFGGVITSANCSNHLSVSPLPNPPLAHHFNSVLALTLEGQGSLSCSTESGWSGAGAAERERGDTGGATDLTTLPPLAPQGRFFDIPVSPTAPRQADPSRSQQIPAQRNIGKYAHPIQHHDSSRAPLPSPVQGLAPKGPVPQRQEGGGERGTWLSKLSKVLKLRQQGGPPSPSDSCSSSGGELHEEGIAMPPRRNKSTLSSREVSVAMSRSGLHFIDGKVSKVGGTGILPSPSSLPNISHKG